MARLLRGLDGILFRFLCYPLLRSPFLPPAPLRASATSSSTRFRVHARISVVSEGAPVAPREVRNFYNRLRPLETERSFARRLAQDDYPYRIVDYRQKNADGPSTCFKWCNHSIRNGAVEGRRYMENGRNWDALKRRPYTRHFHWRTCTPTRAPLRNCIPRTGTCATKSASNSKSSGTWVSSPSWDQVPIPWFETSTARNGCATGPRGIPRPRN